MTRYVKTTWVNNSEPDIDADNLNKIEQGIYDAQATIIGNAADTTPGRLDEKIKQSLEVDGDYKAHLVGDEDTPGADKSYGTDNVGNRGWKEDSGINAIHDDEIGEISAIDEKTTPIDTDIFLIEDSATYFAKKKVTVANIKSVLKTDEAIHDNVAGEITAISEKTVPHNDDVIIIEDSEDSSNKKKLKMSNLPGGTDPNAIHDDTAAEISAITEKASPVGADLLLIEDSEAGSAKKRVQITNLPGGADADAIHDNVAGEIDAITGKTTPVGADLFIIEDSAASNNKKKLTFTNFYNALKSALDSVYAAITHASEHQSGGSDILYQYHRYVWTFTGDCEVAAHPTIFRVGTQAETVVGVYMTVASGDEPTGASLIADIKEDGVTIFSTKPEIDASGNEEDGNEVVSDSSLAADAQISAEITQIGSTLPGTDMTLILLTKEPVA